MPDRFAAKSSAVARITGPAYDVSGVCGNDCDDIVAKATALDHASTVSLERVETSPTHLLVSISTGATSVPARAHRRRGTWTGYYDTLSRDCPSNVPSDSG